MAFEYRITRRVEFVETDMAGIMHFSNFFRFMEAAEAAFFRSLKLPLIEMNPERILGWPRVRASCDYHAPVRFGDEVEVHLIVREIKIRAIRFMFRFRKIVEGREPEALARGEMTTVCATLNPVTHEMESMALPTEVVAALEEAPESAWK